MPQPNDPFDLERFVAAQEPIIESVRAELGSGRKRSHWMWFVFPQIEGLGVTPMSRAYAIRSRAEALAYLEHPILGRRLRECTALVTGVEGRPIEAIFGYPDWLKFRSSMTLFSAIASSDSVFSDALDKCCGGERDPLTLQKLTES